MENNIFFDKCFANKDNSYFKNMMEIIERSKKYKTTEKYLEKHHIVPKAWFKYHRFDVDNSEENIVYLTCKDHLRIHVLLYYYFALVENFKMVEKTLSAIYFMTQKGSSQLVHYGDISKEEYDEYERLRLEYYKKGLYRNRKYTDEYLRQCFDIYKRYDDPYEAHKQVVQQMGFKYERRRTLQERMKKYIPKEEYDAVISRQLEYLRSKQKIDTKDKMEKRKQIKSEQKRLKFEENKKKLIEMYKYYEKYGIRYMKYKFPKFHTTSFLEKCSKYGIIDYSPSKSTKKMKIMYRGCEYGLNELVKILGVCKYYNKIVSLHSKCNMKYEDIFKSIDDGTFVELKVIDKNNENVENKCEFMKFLKNKFIGCIVYDFEYVHMCEMDIDGCQENEIEKWFFDGISERRECHSMDEKHFNISYFNR